MPFLNLQTVKGLLGDEQKTYGADAAKVISYIQL